MLLHHPAQCPEQQPPGGDQQDASCRTHGAARHSAVRASAFGASGSFAAASGPISMVLVSPLVSCNVKQRGSFAAPSTTMLRRCFDNAVLDGVIVSVQLWALSTNCKVKFF